MPANKPEDRDKGDIRSVPLSPLSTLTWAFVGSSESSNSNQERLKGATPISKRRAGALPSGGPSRARAYWMNIASPKESMR